MSFNIWVGGVKAGQPLSQTAEVMKLADVIGVQETHEDEIDNSVEVAKQLGWHHFPQGGNKAVISRFPITGHTPKKTGVFIELTPDQQICLFNVHFPASPYQPYQLLNIEYGDAPFIKTEREAIDWARRSRGEQLIRMLVELSQVRDRGIPTFVTGDFNEPSHLDWTRKAAKQGVHPIEVRYPTAKFVAAHGLIDAYRHRHPNELARPGFTWTPLTEPTDTADHHDRIDFVFSDRRFCTVGKCNVVGEAAESADIVIAPWPSDHRAVMATVELKNR
jgi:exonuclease III